MSGSRYWERQPKRFDHAALILNARFHRMARAVGDAVRGADEVLEVAAGTGIMTAAAAPLADRYVATDQTSGMLVVLSRMLGDLPNLETGVADAPALDFSDASFDAVVMANLLRLLPDARRQLSPPGGEL